MRLPRLGLLAAIALVCAVRAALACSSAAGPFSLFFEFGSAQISAQGRNTIKQVATIAASKAKAHLPASCERLTILGQADTAEAAVPGGRIDVARAEAVLNALDEQGVPRGLAETEGRMGKKNYVDTGPGVREPQNRNAVVLWIRGEGRLRCDPATKFMPSEPPSLCGETYRECYWELKDGTICNFSDAPSPNPVQYSTIVTSP
jgi:hypothetical protein